MVSIGPAQQVVLEVALGMMRQQYDHAVFRFSQHVLALQDQYFDGVTQRTNEFELAAQLNAPSMPLHPIQVRRAEEKFDFLYEQLANVAEAEIQRFFQDSVSIRSQLEGILIKTEQEAKNAERRRQDEFLQATTLCRREVSATIALVKSEQAHSATEVSAMNALKASLEEVSKELDGVRARSERAIAEAHVSSVKQRTELLKELDKQRAAFELERQEVSEQIRSLMGNLGAQQAKYSRELAALAQESSDRIAEMNERLSKQQQELATLNAENVQLRGELARRDRDASMESLHLKKQIGSMELENERLKLSLDSEREQHSFSTQDIRSAVEARRSAEIEQFKRRLIESVSVGSPPSSFSVAARGAASPYSPSSGRYAPPTTAAAAATQLSSSRTRGSVPRSPYSTADAHGSYGAPELAAPHADMPDASAVYASEHRSPSHQPSDAYLRLQNLASSWKDRLASSPSRVAGSPKPWT